MTTAALTAPIERKDFRRHLRDALLEQRGGIFKVLVLSAFGSAVGLALPYTSTLAIDTALPDASPRTLFAAAIGVVLLVGYQAWSGWLRSLAYVAVSAAVEKSALATVFAAVVRSDYATLRKQRSGSMGTTLSSAGTAVQIYIGSLSSLVSNGAFAISHFVVLSQASLAMAALVVIADAVMALISLLAASLEANHTRLMLEKSSEQHQHLHSLMSGLSSLRGLYAVERMGAEYAAKVGEVGSLSMRIARSRAVQSVISSIGSQGLSTGIMIWAVYQCFDGALSLGSMMFLISSSSSLSGSVKGLVGVVTSFRALRPHLERVDQVLAAKQDELAKAPPMWTRDDIVVQDVHFRYGSEGRWVIEGQSLTIQRGQIFQLQSPSGSGKTTLLRMIAGLTTPTSGKITVFGVEARRARDAVLYVPQHSTLFETSIRENLELLSGVPYAQVLPVAELTGLTRVLQSLPMREETQISAQGQNVSSGQRQLIVLTAAFASARSVLLLDEATSQVDAASRERIDWQRLAAGRTIVRVEHG
jgi:ABC-type bacteriocin/lantibiotic exporter with double-glycine peptidase domain